MSPAKIDKMDYTKKELLRIRPVRRKNKLKPAPRAGFIILGSFRGSSAFLPNLKLIYSIST